MAAASALQLISTGIGAISTVAQGINESRQAEFQANVREQQAKREEVLAAQRERDFRLKQEQTIGEYRAAAGAGGVHLDSGSVLASFANFRGEEELQAHRIQESGRINAMRLRQGAQLERMAGSNARIASFGRAGASLLTGFSKYRGSPRVAGATYAGAYN